MQDLNIAASSDNGNKLGALKGAAQEALGSARMPTTRDEDYKFTDLSSLLDSSLCLPSQDAPALNEQVLCPN